MAIKFKNRILEYLKDNKEARSQELSLYIGLKISRTRDYLSELVEEGKIVANGANKNRTYSLIKVKDLSKMINTIRRFCLRRKYVHKYHFKQKKDDSRLEPRYSRYGIPRAE